MKDEYIIINKTQLLKRIEECDKKIYILQRVAYNQLGEDLEITNIAIARLLSEKDTLTSFSVQSTPLIPEIEKAFLAGRSLENIDSVYDIKPTYSQFEDYIPNLKLNI